MGYTFVLKHTYVIKSAELVEHSRPNISLFSSFCNDYSCIGSVSTNLSEDLSFFSAVATSLSFLFQYTRVH